MKYFRNFIRYLIVISIVLVVLSTGCKPKSQIGPTPTPKAAVPGVVINQEPFQTEHIISVFGYGEILCPPDYSTITLSANSEAETKDEAYKKCEEILDAVIQTAKSYGVKDEEIRIEGIHVDWSVLENVHTEIQYNAEGSIVVMAEDAEAADELLPDILEQTGAVLNDVTYTLKNYDQHYYAALTAAIENAHERAIVMAKAAGLSIGSAVAIKEITDRSDLPLSADSSNATIPVVARVSAEYLILH